MSLVVPATFLSANLLSVLSAAPVSTETLHAAMAFPGLNAQVARFFSPRDIRSQVSLS